MEDNATLTNDQVPVPEPPKRGPGAPPGNQNARTHGFYSHILDETMRAALEAAVDVDGLDGEIALLRIKLRNLMDYAPDNLPLIVKATNALARLIKTRFDTRKEDNQALSKAVANVLRDMALPLGLGKRKEGNSEVKSPKAAR